MPFDLDIECEADVNDLIDDESQKILGLSFGQISTFLKFLKDNLSSELLSSCKQY